MKYFLSFVLICFLLFPLSACSQVPPYDDNDLLASDFFISPPPHQTTAVPTATPAPTPRPATGGGGGSGGGGSIIVPTPKPITQLSSPVLELSTNSLTWKSIPNADSYLISFQHQTSLDSSLTENVYTSSNSLPLSSIPTNFIGLVTITAISTNLNFPTSLPSSPTTIANTLPESLFPSTSTVFITSSPDTNSSKSVTITSNLTSLSIVFAQSFFAKNFTVTSPTATKITLSSASSSAYLSVVNLLINAPLASVFQEICFETTHINLNVSANSFNNNAPIFTTLLNISGGKVRLNSANSNIDLISSTALTAEMEVNVPTFLNLSSSASLSVFVNANNTSLNLVSLTGGTFPNIYVKANDVSIINSSAFVKNIDISASSKNTTILNSSHINAVNNLSSTTVYAKTDAATAIPAFNGVAIKSKLPLFLSGISAINRQYNQTTNVSLSGILQFKDGTGNNVTGIEITTLDSATALNSQDFVPASTALNSSSICPCYFLSSEKCLNISAGCAVSTHLFNIGKKETIVTSTTSQGGFSCSLASNVSLAEIGKLNPLNASKCDISTALKCCNCNQPSSLTANCHSEPDYRGTANLSSLIKSSDNLQQTTTLFGSMLNKNAGNGKIVVPNIQLAAHSANEYVLVIAPILVDIAKSPLSLKPATINTPYNGTATLTVFNLQLLNEMTEDVTLFSGDISVQAQCKNVGISQLEVISSDILSGLDAKNYSVDPKNISINIIKAPLYNVLTTLTEKFNDGTPLGKVNSSSILGIISGDLVSVDMKLSAAVYDTVIPTSSANVLITLAITGEDSDNYDPPTPFHLSGQVILKNTQTSPTILGVEFFLEPFALEYYICEIVSPQNTTLDFSAGFYDYPITKIAAPLFSDFVTTIILPDSLKEIPKGAFNGCTALTSVIVSENNLYFTLKDGVLYSKDLSEKIFIPQS